MRERVRTDPAGGSYVPFGKWKVAIPEPTGDVSCTRVGDGWVIARANTQPGEGRIIQLSYLYDPEDT